MDMLWTIKTPYLFKKVVFIHFNKHFNNTFHGLLGRWIHNYWISARWREVCIDFKFHSHRNPMRYYQVYLIVELSVIGWIFILPKKFTHVEILTPELIVFRDGSFERWLDLECEGFMNGISDFVQEILENSFTLSYTNMTICESGNKLPLDTESTSTLTLDFQNFRTMENKLLFRSPRLWYFCYSILNRWRKILRYTDVKGPKVRDWCIPTFE